MVLNLTCAELSEVIGRYSTPKKHDAAMIIELLSIPGVECVAKRIHKVHEAATLISSSNHSSSYSVSSWRRDRKDVERNEASCYEMGKGTLVLLRCERASSLCDLWCRHKSSYDESAFPARPRVRRTEDAAMRLACPKRMRGTYELLEEQEQPLEQSQPWLTSVVCSSPSAQCTGPMALGGGNDQAKWDSRSQSGTSCLSWVLDCW